MSPLPPTSAESQAYADAIMDVVEAIAQLPGNGNMGALLGALVGVQAHFIAGISDGKIRKGLRRDCDKMLSEMIRNHIETGNQARVHTIIKRAH